MSRCRSCLSHHRLGPTYWSCGGQCELAHPKNCIQIHSVCLAIIHGCVLQSLLARAIAANKVSETCASTHSIEVLSTCLGGGGGKGTVVLHIKN